MTLQKHSPETLQKNSLEMLPRKIAVLQCPNDAQLAENLILATPARGHLRLVELPKIANITN